MTQTLSKIIVIGSSSGGPAILKKILADLPGDIPATFLLVQHLPENYENFFFQNLQRYSKLKIVQATGKVLLEKGKIFIIPQNSYPGFKKSLSGKIYMNILPLKEQEKNTFPINRIMTEAATHFHEKTLGIILSGMGFDGLEGIKNIKKHGGYTIIQKPQSCSIASMPLAVKVNDLADEIISPASIAERLKQLCFTNEKL